MDRKIESKKDKIHIKITTIPEAKENLLKNLNDCKEGTCSCPTNEYEKLENLEIHLNDENDEIILDLKPKKDAQFNISEIEKCLDHADKNKN